MYQTLALNSCPNCKGIWFAAGEMQRYLEVMANSPDVPHAQLSLSKNVTLAERLQEPLRICPHCGLQMRKFNYAYDSNVIMERCSGCSGIWTDGGEAYRAAIYNKGNPKLDGLASSMAEHLQKKEDFKEFVEGFDDLSRTGGLFLFAVQGVLPLGDEIPQRSFPSVTAGLIALNAVSFVISLFSEDVNAFHTDLGVIPAHIVSGVDLHTLFTHMFCHASVFHLAGNMLFLWVFANHVEDAFGHFLFALFYILCGLVSAGGFIALNVASNVPLVGASGAIAGVMAAYVVLYPLSSMRVLIAARVITLPASIYLAGWFLMQLFFWLATSGMAHGGVAWFAHIGGFLCGAIVTLPARRHLLARTAEPAAR
jgi:membrane associated rhomboid family serine protease